MNYIKINEKLNIKGWRKNMTLHLNNERRHRYKVFNDLKLFNAGVIGVWLVDKGHRNGKEIHVINHKGVVSVYNANTKNFITFYALRYAQFKRYVGNEENWKEKYKITIEHINDNIRRRLNYV